MLSLNVFHFSSSFLSRTKKRMFQSTFWEVCWDQENAVVSTLVLFFKAKMIWWLCGCSVPVYYVTWLVILNAAIVIVCLQPRESFADTRREDARIALLTLLPQQKWQTLFLFLAESLVNVGGFTLIHRTSFCVTNLQKTCSSQSMYRKFAKSISHNFFLHPTIFWQMSRGYVSSSQ